MGLSNLGAVVGAVPTLSLTPALASLAEGSASGNSITYLLTLARKGASGTVGYSWSVAGSGASPASASDFAGGVFPSGSGSFAAGETARTITIAFAGDAAFEPDEGFTVTVAASLTLDPAAAEGRILNDDVAPPPSLLMGSRYNQAGFNGYAGSNGTDTNSNCRLGSYNETGAAATKVRGYFANWFANTTNEQDGYNAITVSAAIEYPAGNFTPLAFGGASSVSIAPTGAASLAESDEAILATPIPAGALYWVRTYVAVAAGGKWVQGYLRLTGYPELGEAADFNTGVDKSAGGAIANAPMTGYPETRAGYGPIAVKATGFAGTPVARAFAAIGDSLVMGSNDSHESPGIGHGNIGYFAKACAGYCPVVNLGIASTTAANNGPGTIGRRAALLAKVGVTHVFCDWSVNDIIAGRSASQLAGDVAAIAAGLKTAAPGVKVVWTTLTPRTTSTDGWKTVAGQTVAGGGFAGGAASVRAQFNAALRGGIAGVNAVFDAADAVETARDSGLWRAGEGSAHQTGTGATTDAATNDGLHPTTFNTAPPGLGGVYLLRDAARTAMAGW